MATPLTLLGATPAPRIQVPLSSSIRIRARPDGSRRHSTRALTSKLHEAIQVGNPLEQHDRGPSRRRDEPASQDSGRR